MILDNMAQNFMGTGIFLSVSPALQEMACYDDLIQQIEYSTYECELFIFLKSH